MPNTWHYYGSKAKPKEAFGEDTSEFFAFYKAEQIVAPGASKYMQIMLHYWQPHALQHTINFPDGFVGNIKEFQKVDTKIEVDELNHASFIYRHQVNEGTETGLSLIANTVQGTDGFVVRELSRRCNYNESSMYLVRHLISRILHERKTIYTNPKPFMIEQMWRDHNFISLVGIDYINVWSIDNYSTDYLEKLLDLIERVILISPFPVISVFDEFQAHANNMNEVRYWYKEIFAEMAEATMLDAFLTSITGTPIHIEKFSDDLGDLIRSSEYSLS